jgi:predicted ATPase/DNA-binding winged helix-turn-helix (wHTH) protein
MPQPHWRFGPFRLDPDQACLWHGAQAVPLTPKAFRVLHHLVTHPHRLITKAELFDAVWPATAVSEAALRVCIGELRHALGDAARAPRYIATMARRGYRFLAPVTRQDSGAGSVADPAAPRPPLVAPPTGPLVGREAVLSRLHTAWAQACQGVRQVCFVGGEAGIGKTAVVEAFTAQVTTAPHVWLAQGQCVEHYGTREAYRPVLEALGQLVRAPEGTRLVALLRQQAPTWLVQLPWLLTEADRRQFAYELQGTTRERMLRELAEVLETLTAETPLVLVLEDLHWSDYATLDLLALLARRRTPARLLVLGTYRPVDVIVAGHPLRTVLHDLQQHGYGQALLLEPLTVSEVAAYLHGRFGPHQFPATLAPALHQRTEGHPLFLRTVVEALVQQGTVVQVGGAWTLPGAGGEVVLDVPERLRPLIAQQVAQLSAAEQQVLEATSVAGSACAVAAVAAALEADESTVDDVCATLARRGQFLEASGEVRWPDGTLTACYRFRHSLYYDVLYHRIPLRRRQQLHQRMGVREEVGYGARAGERAAVLAEHFARGGDARRAVHYLRQAGENALRRSAHREAVTLLTQGLALLAELPATPERLQREVDMQIALGASLLATHGYAAPEVGALYAAAQQRCAQLDAPHQRFPVLRGLWNHAYVRAELQTAHTLGEQLLSLAHQVQDPAMLVAAHRDMGATLFQRGAVAAAHRHLAQGIALYESQQYRAAVVRHGQDAGVLCRSYAAAALWHLGYPDQAGTRIQEAVTLAHQLTHPFSLTVALGEAALFHQGRREGPATQERAEATLGLATAQGFRHWQARGTVLRGWALAQQGRVQEGLAQLTEGLRAYRATGAQLALPHYLTLLAEVYGIMGQPEAGLTVLTEALALVAHTGVRLWEAELYRLKGALLVQQSAATQGEAATCFQHALALAQNHHAKAWELRAATSLARLWQQQGQRAEAYALLAPVYGWFTEGFDTADLQEAKALLEALG